VKRLISMSVTGALALMLLLPNPSSAAEIKGGIKIGLNLANLTGDAMADLDDYLGENIKSKLGFCLGGFVTYHINEMFAVQPEVLITMKGARYKEEIRGEILKVWINLTYLEIPVLAKITLPTLGIVKPSLYAGPALAIKLSGKVKAESEGVTVEVDVEDMKGIDLGLVIGAGIDWGKSVFGVGKLAVDLRYTLGLSTISEFENDDVKNGAFSLMVGLSF
jgi:hypothetical protein